MVTKVSLLAGLAAVVLASAPATAEQLIAESQGLVGVSSVHPLSEAELAAPARGSKAKAIKATVTIAAAKLAPKLNPITEAAELAYNGVNGYAQVPWEITRLTAKPGADPGEYPGLINAVIKPVAKAVVAKVKK